MDGWVTVGTKLNTKDFDRQIKLLKTQLKDLEEDYNILKRAKPFEGQTEALSKLNKQIISTKKELASVEQQRNNLTKNGGFKNVENSMSNIVKKVAKWSLALFGISSIFGAIKSSMSILTQYDSQLATDIQYIKYALATAIKPIIDTIVSLVYKLLAYINEISVSLFNFNLFQNASVDNFKKMSKSAQEIKKSLAGFDEMNIISDTSSADSSGGSDITPSIDLSKVQKDIQKSKNFWKNIFDFWEKDWENWFIGVEGNWGSFIEGLGTTLKGLYDTFKGVFELIGGVIKLFVALFTGDTEMLKEAWDAICKAFVDILKGIVETILGILLTILGAIKGLLLDIWDGIVSIFSTVASWIYDNVIKPVGDFFAGMWNGFKEGASSAWEGVKQIFSTVADFFKNIFTNAWEGVKKVFSTGGQIFKGIADGIFNAFKKVVNTLITGINKVVAIPFNAINTALKKIRDISFLGISPFKGLIKLITVPQIPKLAKGGIISMPGRGVPVGMGQAIGGEAGREGVIPLTDSQQMQLLGEAIGKYININLTNVTKLDNRQIAREQKIINAQNDFAYNR